MLLEVALGAVALAGGALAQRNAPCAVVASSAASYLRDYPNANSAIVPADIAEACLKSVPIDVGENKLLIEELMLYLSWQSNIKWMMDPPAGYTEDRIDVIDKVQKIYDGLDAGEWTNEYDFQLALYKALAEANDFHLGFTPDILGVFFFQRANLSPDELFALTSVSADGTSVPALYNYYDIKSILEGAQFNPSPITKINGVDSERYVEDWAKLTPYHDKDARYNRQFINQAGLSVGDEVNEFVLNYVPDGATTDVTYANGTVISYNNYASVLKDFTGITSGEDFYAAFLNQAPPRQQKKKRDIEKRQNQAAPGYPDPVIIHSENVISGYYLAGQGFEDVAVLAVPSFGPATENGGTEFQNVVGAFLQDAKDKGAKRLVIDLRSNGGGRIFLGYDLFKQLFPKIDPWGATRFRANSAFNLAGQAMTKMLTGYTLEEAIDDVSSGAYNGNLAFAWQSIFNYKVPRNAEGKPFGSWEELFGPERFNDDDFTNLQRYDFSNFFSDDLDIDVSGYRSRADALMSDSPFASENILMILDGTCGSTCAIFHELMKTQGKVQSVVLGGTPNNGPMQGVAGSKGAQVYDFKQVWDEAASTYNFLVEDQSALNDTELGQLVFSERPLRRVAYSSSGAPLARINLRDNHRQGDSSGIPLEFIYEASDCRLWYTVDMLGDPGLVWQTAANARWNNWAGCVQGSVGDKSSLNGGFKPGQASAGGKKNDADRLTRSIAAMSFAAVASVMVLLL